MRNWFITGVSSGLGQALAAEALRRGDRVVGTVRTLAAQTDFANVAPGRSLGALMDVTDEAQVRKVVADAERQTGGIDVLINNAGYGLVSGVEEVGLDEMRAQFEANVFGVVCVMQAVLPFMRARRAGRIVNITSVSGLVGWPSLGIYSGSKFALEGISETLAQELEPLGIKVIMIEPGGLRTDFATRSRRQSAHIIDDYDATVGACRRLLAEHAGHEAGDPVRAAEIILDVATADAPPQRLLLGSDAIGYATRKLQQQSDEIETWKAISAGTDFTAVRRDSA
jgi:NAD(P)-dependent dehydrogenase (short-subunit alcohol dehydrogenase family)